jgi:esterase/lipase superfamily enzyme
VKSEGEYHTWHSPRLGHGFELKVYGWQGKPLLVFPSSKGRFYQYEDFGMVAACHQFLDQGKVKIFAVDGIDWETWWNESAHPADKARRHEDYHACIVDEVVPFIHQHCRVGPIPIMTTGCSFGAYHAVNFLFRRPEVFDTCIALSGVYSVEQFVGGYCDDNVYRNDPMRYLLDLNDGWLLERYRQARIILCSGRGAWEDQFLAATRALSDVLRSKGIDHWLDEWGHDVNHDWPWWRKQIAYFLGRLEL